MSISVYTPNHVANYMLERSDIEDRKISQLTLFNLVYFAYGWVLALTDQKLFNEPIYAWSHGPVIRSLYNEFKRFEKKPVGSRSINYDLDNGDIHIPMISQNDEDIYMIHDRVWNIYKRFDEQFLCDLIREKDGPWNKIYNKNTKEMVIPNSLISEHFKYKIGKYVNNCNVFS